MPERTIEVLEVLVDLSFRCLCEVEAHGLEKLRLGVAPWAKGQYVQGYGDAHWGY